MENKTKSRENKSHNILQVPIFNKGRTCFIFIFYFALSSYYPHIKFLGITSDNRITFRKHFEEILEPCNNKFHRLRILVNKKWGPSPETSLQIYKQCVRLIFEYGIVFTIPVSESVIKKIQRVQNSFIRQALHLPTYVSARLIHEASRLPYVRERLITVGQNHLARMHANPLLEHTISSARANITWDKYKAPISILKPPDRTNDTDCKMQEHEVISLNVQPLILKVVVRPIHGHVWHSPRTQNQKPTRLPGSRFSWCYKHPTAVAPWRSHLIILHHYLTTTVICGSNYLHK